MGMPSPSGSLATEWPVMGAASERRGRGAGVDTVPLRASAAAWAGWDGEVLWDSLAFRALLRAASLPDWDSKEHSVPWTRHMRQTRAPASTAHRDFLRRQDAHAGREWERYGRAVADAPRVILADDQA